MCNSCNFRDSIRVLPAYSCKFQDTICILLNIRGYNLYNLGYYQHTPVNSRIYTLHTPGYHLHTLGYYLHTLVNSRIFSAYYCTPYHQRSYGVVPLGVETVGNNMCALLLLAEVEDTERITFSIRITGQQIFCLHHRDFQHSYCMLHRLGPCEQCRLIP